VIESKFEDTEGAEAIGFSHGDFGFVVQTLHDAAGKQLRGMAFLLAGKPSGRTTLTVIDRILHTP